MNEKYNDIGKTYNQTRKADQRILQRIITELELEPGSNASDYQQLGEGEPPIDVHLYYYDMMGKKEKHFKKVKIKYEDLKKFNLIPLR